MCAGNESEMNEWLNGLTGRLNKESAMLAPQVLAYIGDAVYELMIRVHLVSEAQLKPTELHRRVVAQVRAPAQARLVRELEDQLTPDEAAVFRRGRNAKSGQVPKGAEVVEYRLSTGLEALVGYLFLSGNYSRLNWVLSQAIILMGDTKSYE